MYQKVYPFAGIAEAVLPDTPRLMMNQEATGSFVDNPQANDVVAKGNAHVLKIIFYTILYYSSLGCYTVQPFKEASNKVILVIKRSFLEVSFHWRDISK